MAYQAPGIQPRGRQPMPTFASGYATYEATEGRNFWRGLTLAFAPFLGPVGDPTKLLFGRTPRPGTASFSGGRPAAGVHGWGWEFTATNNSIVCGLANDAFPFKKGSAGALQAEFTAIIGFRKTDATLRNHFLWGTGTSIFNSIGLRYSAGTDAYFGVIGGSTSNTFTPAAGFNKQDFHVFANRGVSQPTTEPALFIDGQTVAVNQGAADSPLDANNLTIGNGAGGQAADLMIIDFFYLWNLRLTPSAIAEITADPGMLFRPVPRTVSRGPLPLPIPPILAATVEIEGGDLDVVTDFPGPYFRVATGLRNLGNALARRLTTPRGGLFYDPNYGLDVRNYLSAGMTPQQLAQVQSDVADEVSKDPRVDNVTVAVAQNLAAARMAITISCELAEGPFEFVVNVTNLTVELLSVSALS